MQSVREYLDARAKSDNDPDDEDSPDVTVRTDPEARRLADTPHLTGDPEWDAAELAETDPTRSLLRERMQVA
jgi:hypothetical protein